VCLYALCRVKGPHAHFPIYRPYVNRMIENMNSQGLDWEDILGPIAEMWVRHAKPWIGVGGRAFTNRSTNFNGTIPVAPVLEREVDNVQYQLRRELYIFLLNRLIDDVLEERHRRQNDLLAALKAVGFRGDVP